MAPKKAAGLTPGQQAMNEEHAFKRRDWDPKLVRRLQALCMAYPEAVEAEQFGGPWWKAGTKAFCLYGAESQRNPDGGYRGVDGMAVKLPLADQDALLLDPRFHRERYLGRHGWTVLRFSGTVDWDEVGELVDSAYRNVANHRQLAALDGCAPARR